MTPASEQDTAHDAYMDEMRRCARGSAIWTFAAGVALGAMPGFAIWFAASEDFYAGAGTLAMGWVVFVALGRAEIGIMRILTELSHHYTLATLQSSIWSQPAAINPYRTPEDILNSRSGSQINPSADAERGPGGEDSVTLRPVGSETVLHFSKEIARIK